MEEQNHSFGQKPNTPYQNPFISASFILGIIGIVTCCCIYVSLACGGLSIIFALLSKGGEKKISRPARNSLAIGIVAIVATVAITAASFIITIKQYGGFDNMMEYYQNVYNTYVEALE